MNDLKNKKVLITGGSRGIGKEIALAFAREGSDIIIADIQKGLFDSTKKEIESLGVSCHCFLMDVTLYNNIVSVKDQINKDIGKIDILVNNAGVVFGGKFLDIPIEKHQFTYDVNVNGVVNVTHVFLKDLMQKSRSNIVNISSASGFIPLAGGATYSSSKACVTNFSESLITELKRSGNSHVKITIVCPSYVRTGMFDGARNPIFVPILTPQKLAKKIIKGVKKDKRFVLEPLFIKFVPFMKGVFPQFFLDFLCKFMGVDGSMDKWKGHSK